MFTEILLLMMLVLLNAFFASSEIALISLNDNKIKLMAEEGNKKALLLRNLLAEPSKFLATIQIGITLAGFLASAFASETFADEMVTLFKHTGLRIPETALKTVSMLIITLILSYFTLVLGELVPKRLGMRKSETISMFAARPLTFLSSVASPFVKLLTVSTNSVVKLFGINPYENDQEVTEEEIRMMVDVGEERGAIDESEKEMINNIFDFDNKTVMDIMTHRTDIIALPVESSLKDVVSVINEEKYSRIPVYEDTIDNIIGVLHIKDLLPYIGHEKAESNFCLRELIRSPYNVPSSKRTDELFRELQRNKTHMAIIIDEYGGTAGIVTIEDLMEEIVGNIFDEYDEEEKDFEKLDENTYMVSGSAELDVVKEYLDAELPVGEYETLSGFVIGQLGRIPEQDEKLEIEFGGFVFKIEEVEEKRISKIKICKAY